MTSISSNTGRLILIAAGLLLLAGTVSVNAKTIPDGAVPPAQSNIAATNSRIMSSGPSGLADLSVGDNERRIPANVKLPMKLAGNGRI
jgi:hypothetical protein